MQKQAWKMDLQFKELLEKKNQLTIMFYIMLYGITWPTHWKAS